MDSRNLLQNAIGYRRASTGASPASLAELLMAATTAADYWALPKGTPSPDGKLVVFDSDMNAAGRYDVFIAEVPVR